MTKKSTKSRRSRLARAEKEAEDLINAQVEQIDEAVASIEEKLKPYERLREQRDRLLRSRSALLGGTRLTGSGTKNLRQEDVVRLVGENPGSTIQELADKASSSYSAMNMHLSRGKDERFLNKEKRWYLRDPKNGINTADDIEEDDE